MDRVLSVALITNTPDGYFKKHFYEYFNEKFNVVLIELEDCYDFEKNYKNVHSKVDDYGVQFCFFQMGDLALKLHDIAKIKCQKICFVTDDDWMYSIRTRYASLYFSRLISTHVQNKAFYDTIGIDNIIYSQWACNPSLYKPSNVKKDIDISFIGGPHADRVELLRYLIANGKYVKIYGRGWNRIEDLKKYWGGYLTNLEVVDVINRSKVCLNPGKSSTMRGFQIKGRTFELAGCAAFQLTDSTTILDDYFIRGTEIITYDNYEELLEQITYYLSRNKERESIAKRAYDRVISEHTWAHRLDNIFNDISNIPSNYEFKSGTERQPIVDVIYLTNNSISLYSKTISSLNSQSYNNFCIRMVGRQKVNTVSLNNKIDLYSSCEEALKSIDGSYVLFISDGDIWEPEKIQMQVFAMESDIKDNIEFNLATYGLYISNSREEDFSYSYRSLLTSNRNIANLEFHIVPSSLIASKNIVRKYLDEFTLFLMMGSMGIDLQKKIGLSSKYYNFIDLQYSLARINYNSFRNDLASIQIEDSHVFNSAWVTTQRTKRLILKLLKKGMLLSAYTFLISVIFEKPRYYNILLNKKGKHLK